VIGSQKRQPGASALDRSPIVDGLRKLEELEPAVDGRLRVYGEFGAPLGLTESHLVELVATGLRRRATPLAGAGCCPGGLSQGAGLIAWPAIGGGIQGLRVQFGKVVERIVWPTRSNQSVGPLHLPVGAPMTEGHGI
jgi:hypothetical protein